MAKEIITKERELIGLTMEEIHFDSCGTYMAFHYEGNKAAVFECFSEYGSHAIRIVTDEMSPGYKLTLGLISDDECLVMQKEEDERRMALIKKQEIKQLEELKRKYEND